MSLISNSLTIISKEFSLAFETSPSPVDHLSHVGHSFYFPVPLQRLPFGHLVPGLGLGGDGGQRATLGDSPCLLSACASAAAIACAFILSHLDTPAIGP